VSVVEDVVRTLGFLCLGSRLRRIGERLQADTQRIIDEMGVPIQTSQFPLLAAIDRLGPLSVGELAEAVGMTQPGATRGAALLVKAGFLEAEATPGDQRRRVLSLTRDGQHLVEAAKRDLWPRIEAAVADLCENLEGPLLGQLASIEDGLIAQPLDGRSPTARKVRR
jgi:DNA-binding MarR family transcriptional regulator